MILASLLDEVQSYLHDDSTIWSRAELLRWANDGYRTMLAQSRAVVRPFQLDVPGRSAWSTTFGWESRHALGTAPVFTISIKAQVALSATYLWETEAVERIDPTTTLDCTSQQWERAYSDEVDAHFQFVLPKSNERPLKVYWDNKRLAHTGARELDASLRQTAWWRQTSEPLAWLPALGSEGALELFELQTTYHQAYELRYGDSGIPRAYSSDAGRAYVVQSSAQTWDFAYTSSGDLDQVTGLGYRFAYVVSSTLTDGYGSYSWESDTNTASDESTDQIATFDWESSDPHVELALGVSRQLLSNDRQYVAVSYDSGYDLAGSPRRFASGDDALTIWMAIVPTRPLTESDEPGLLHPRLHMYIKFYVLGKALGRPGQGYRPDLAQHWDALYQLGVGLLTMLGTPSVLDRVYAREQTQDASIQAPPKVRLPATFERRF